MIEPVLNLLGLLVQVVVLFVAGVYVFLWLVRIGLWLRNGDFDLFDPEAWK